jgi:hypothetical protein
LGNVMVMNARPSVIAPTRKLIRSNVVAVSIETVIIGVFLFCLMTSLEPRGPTGEGHGSRRLQAIVRPVD